jgi:hypothetical protein
MTAPAEKNTVKDALTPHLPFRQGRRSGRTGGLVVENDAYSAFLRRAIRAAGRRVGNGDVDGLAELLAFAGELDSAIDSAVRGLRNAGYSWGEIASRLGVTPRPPNSDGAAPLLRLTVAVRSGDPGQPVPGPLLGSRG